MSLCSGAIHLFSPPTILLVLCLFPGQFDPKMSTPIGRRVYVYMYDSNGVVSLFIFAAVGAVVWRCSVLFFHLFPVLMFPLCWRCHFPLVMSIPCSLSLSLPIPFSIYSCPSAGCVFPSFGYCHLLPSCISMVILVPAPFLFCIIDTEAYCVVKRNGALCSDLYRRRFRG